MMGKERGGGGQGKGLGKGGVFEEERNGRGRVGKGVCLGG